MVNDYLPIGSVILLKNAKKRLMITGYHIIDKENNKTYDYCGCLYPEGYISTDRIAVFNHNQIDKVFHLGLNDSESVNFKKKLNNILKNDNN